MRRKSLPTAVPAQVKSGLGLNGYVDFYQWDPETENIDQAEHWHVKNTIKDAMRSAIASLIAGTVAGVPTHMAVGDGEADGYAKSGATVGGIRLDNTTFRLYAQQFTVGSTVSIDRVRASPRRVGSSVATMTAEIQTNSAGSPSGTVVTNGTSVAVNVNGFTTDPDGVNQDFDFTTPPSLTAGTYWIVFRPTGYVFVNAATEIYLDGDYLDGTENTLKYWNGTVWAAPGSGGDHTALNFGVIVSFDVTRSSLRHELQRNALGGISKPNDYSVRYTALFGPTEAIGVIAEIGMFDAAISGNLLTYTETNREKRSGRVLLVIWTINVTAS